MTRPKYGINFANTAITSTGTSVLSNTDYITRRISIGDGFTSASNDNGLITVNQQEYEELKADSELLYALIEEGVEDWEGYDRAILNI